MLILSLIINCGSLFIDRYNRPIYSPTNPILKSIIPPKRNIADINEVQPNCTEGSHTFLIKRMINIIRLNKEKNIPQKETNLNGITEKFVNPFNHSCNSFFKL